jgi:ammonia channel protein AmtB
VHKALYFTTSVVPGGLLYAPARGRRVAGDNAWMLVNAALVLMMTGPGLALFYGALVRRKNVLGTMMQSFIMAHMVWGKGELLNAFLGGRIATLDSAGGAVVHITSGVSALVCALYLGKRLGYPGEAMKPHSLVLSFIDACLLHDCTANIIFEIGLTV